MKISLKDTRGGRQVAQPLMIYVREFSSMYHYIAHQFPYHISLTYPLVIIVRTLCYEVGLNLPFFHNQSVLV